MKRLTLKKLNKMFSDHGIQEVLVKGDAFFYFQDGESDEWEETTVMVFRLNDLTIDQWLREWEFLSGKKANRIDDFPVPKNS